MRTIASERTLKGMTQEDLANEIGVHRMTIARWESGETKPSTSDIKALSEVFGCSVDYLLGISENRV